MQLAERKSAHKKLGFDKLEVAEIINKLNISLSTYQVFFHDVQNFHWNVVGSDFFDVHDLTEELYREALEDIDAIAERVRILGGVPTNKLKDYLELSLIEESSHEMSGYFMVHRITENIQALIESLLDAYEFTTENGDVSSTRLITDIISKLEKYHWKLTSWSNQKFK